MIFKKNNRNEMTKKKKKSEKFVKIVKINFCFLRNDFIKLRDFVSVLKYFKFFKILSISSRTQSIINIIKASNKPH